MDAFFDWFKDAHILNWKIDVFRFREHAEGKIERHKGFALSRTIPTIKDISRVPQKYNIRGKQIQEIKLLSEGSFGFIWLAEDIATKQKYALKRIVCITNDRLHLAKN